MMLMAPGESLLHPDAVWHGMTFSQIRLVLRRHEVAQARRDLRLLQTTHVATAAALMYYNGKPAADAFDKYTATLRDIIIPPTPGTRIRGLISKLKQWKTALTS